MAIIPPQPPNPNFNNATEQAMIEILKDCQTFLQSILDQLPFPHVDRQATPPKLFVYELEMLEAQSKFRYFSAVCVAQRPRKIVQYRSDLRMYLKKLIGFGVCEIDYDAIPTFEEGVNDKGALCDHAKGGGSAAREASKDEFDALYSGKEVNENELVVPERVFGNFLTDEGWVYVGSDVKEGT